MKKSTVTIESFPLPGVHAIGAQFLTQVEPQADAQLQSTIAPSSVVAQGLAQDVHSDGAIEDAKTGASHWDSAADRPYDARQGVDAIYDNDSSDDGDTGPSKQPEDYECRYEKCIEHGTADGPPPPLLPSPRHKDKLNSAARRAKRRWAPEGRSCGRYCSHPDDGPGSRAPRCLDIPLIPPPEQEWTAKSVVV